MVDRELLHHYRVWRCSGGEEKAERNKEKKGRGQNIEQKHTVLVVNVVFNKH